MGWLFTFSVVSTDKQNFSFSWSPTHAFSTLCNPPPPPPASIQLLEGKPMGMGWGVGTWGLASSESKRSGVLVGEEGPKIRSSWWICPGPTFLQASHGVWQGGAEITRWPLRGAPVSFGSLWLSTERIHQEAKSQIRSDLLKQDTEEAYNFPEGAMPRDLSGLQSHKERKGGNREKITSFLILE